MGAGRRRRGTEPTDPPPRVGGGGPLLRTKLASPWILPALIAAALALHLPTAFMGFFADDYPHQIVLRGELVFPRTRPWSLFDFGGTDDWKALTGGVEGVPWWTSPDWKIRFFRPLTSATLWLDHALFGSWAIGYHLTNLAWYAALLVLVRALYRALGLPGNAALVGLVFFASTNGAVLPVGWIANRSTLLAAVFIVAAIRILVCRGDAVRGRDLAAAFLFALLACLAKESGVVAFALVALWLALASRRTQAPVRRRALAVGGIASLLLAAGYVAILAAAGYGTRSAIYATPWVDAGHYVRNLAVLLTAGPLRLLVPLSLDFLGIFPAAVVPVVGTAALVVSPVAVWMARMLRGRPAAGFLLAWLLLSLCVEGSALPSDRLLLCAAVGSGGLFGMFVATALKKQAVGPGGRRDRALARVFLAAGGVSALFALVQSASVARLARETKAAVLAADVGPPSLGRRDVVVLQSASAFVPLTLAPTWAVESRDRDVRFWIIQMGRRGLRWTRENDRTFLLRSLDEPFLTHILEQVYRTDPRPPGAGATWETPLFSAESVEVDEGGLWAVRFRFDRSLDDPRLRFLVGRGEALWPVAPPEIGESVEIPRAVPASPMAL